MTGYRVAELARSRAAAGLDEEACVAWFGVGRSTLERIEAGEVEPSEDVARRIDRFLCFVGGAAPGSAISQHVGGSSMPPALPGSLVTHEGGSHWRRVPWRPRRLFSGSAVVSSAAIQAALVDQLRVRPMSKGELRAAIGCTPAELAAAIQALRYQGKIAWDRLELSDSMKSGDAINSAASPADGPGGAPSSGPDDEEDYPGEVNDEAQPGPAGDGPLSPEGEAGDGALPVRPPQRALSQRGLEEPRPDRPRDQRTGAPNDDKAAAGGHEAEPAPVAAASRYGRRGGVSAASTRWGSKPVPAPKHEPEIARAVREEATETVQRRHLAASTATVRRPLDLARDLSPADAIASALAEEPHDLMAAIRRRHDETWGRIVRLGRARHMRASATLYDVLDAGLAALEGAPSGAGLEQPNREDSRHAA